MPVLESIFGLAGGVVLNEAAAKLKEYGYKKKVVKAFEAALRDSPPVLVYLCHFNKVFIDNIFNLPKNKMADVAAMIWEAKKEHRKRGEPEELSNYQVVKALYQFAEILLNQMNNVTKAGELPKAYDHFFGGVQNANVNIANSGETRIVGDKTYLVIPDGAVKAFKTDLLSGPQAFLVRKGRNKFLRAHEHWIERIGQALGSEQYVSLWGGGGIGKSAMALEYAYRNRKEYPGGVYWVEAELGLSRAFTGLAVSMGLEVQPDASVNQLTGMVLARLQLSGGKKLIVVDNLEDTSVLVPFTTLGDTCVLATTRKSNVGLARIPMDLPSFAGAREIFLSYAQLDPQALSSEEGEAVDAVVDRVDRLPLALEILGNLVGGGELGLGGLMANLDQAMEAEAYAHCRNAETSVCEVLALADQHYNHPRAAEALKYIAYLDPEHIDKDLLGLVMDEKPDEAQKMLVALAKWSVLSARDSGGYSVHRLIQDAARKGDEDNQVGEQVVERLDVEIERVSESGAYKKAMHLIPTLVHIAGMGRDELPLDDFPIADTLGRWAKLIEDCGNYPMAEGLKRQVLHRVGQEKGFEHKDYATRLNNLALAIKAQGSHSTAEELYRQALEVDRKTIGEEHPSYVTHLSNFANALHAQGKHNEAEELLREAVDIDRLTFNVHDPYHAIRLSSLGVVKAAQGNYEEAKQLYGQALDITKKVLGDDHPTLGTRINNIASILARQGEYTEAEQLFRQALEIDRKTLGEDHPNYAKHLNNLAWAVGQQGKQVEAEPLFRQALAIFQRTLPPDHEHVVGTKEHLNSCLRDQGKPPE